MTKYEKIKRARRQRFIATLIAVFFTAASSYLLFGVFQYFIATDNIQFGNEAGYTYQWNDEIMDEVNEDKVARQELIEENDIAAWCYYSGYSFLGKTERFVTVIGALIVWFLSTVFILEMIWWCITKCIRKRRKVINFQKEKKKARR